MLHFRYACMLGFGRGSWVCFTAAFTWPCQEVSTSPGGTLNCCLLFLWRAVCSFHGYSVLLLDSPVEVKLVTGGYAMFTSSELVLFWNMLTILKYVHCKNNLIKKYKNGCVLILFKKPGQKMRNTLCANWTKESEYHRFMYTRIDMSFSKLEMDMLSYGSEHFGKNCGEGLWFVCHVYSHRLPT